MDENTKTIAHILDFIDNHITQPLTLQDLAQEAGFSPYHFSRIFDWKVGCSVMRYVRERRLAFAACALASSESILHIALEYGFETHSGFSKAFRRRFGATPEAYRRHAVFELPAPPSLETMEHYKLGGLIMEPKMMNLSATKLVGYSIKTTDEVGLNNNEIPAFWSEYISSGKMKHLHSQPFVGKHDEYGACFSMSEGESSFLYMIGVALPDGAEPPAEFTVMEMPAATYAVFSTPPASTAEFTQQIQSTWTFIFDQWFPNSGYEMAAGKVDFELYDDRCMGEHGKVCDIYIPVLKR